MQRSLLNLVDAELEDPQLQPIAWAISGLPGRLRCYNLPLAHALPSSLPGFEVAGHKASSAVDLGVEVLTEPPKKLTSGPLGRGGNRLC